MAVAAPRNRRERDEALRPARHSIYVFELPVRLVHWTIVVMLLVLMITGIYIEHPFLISGGMPGHPGFTLGEIRFIHEAAGFVFIAAVLFRIYWAFVGNEYVHWRGLLPVTSRQRRDLRDTVRFYGFTRDRPPLLNGHNPLAGLAYVILYIGFIISALTGLGLYAWIYRRPPWSTLFSWTWSVMSEPALRLLHFLLMFWYIAFAIHHVYSAVLYDMEERNGELSSMITGYKDNVLEDEAPVQQGREVNAG